MKKIMLFALMVLLLVGLASAVTINDLGIGDYYDFETASIVSSGVGADFQFDSSSYLDGVQSEGTLDFGGANECHYSVFYSFYLPEGFVTNVSSYRFGGEYLEGDSFCVRETDDGSIEKFYEFTITGMYCGEDGEFPACSSEPASVLNLSYTLVDDWSFPNGIVVDDFNKPDGTMDSSSTNNLGTNYYGDGISGGCSYLYTQAYCHDSPVYYNQLSLEDGDTLSFIFKCNSGVCRFGYGRNTDDEMFKVSFVDETEQVMLTYEGESSSDEGDYFSEVYHIVDLVTDSNEVTMYLDDVLIGTYVNVGNYSVSDISFYSFSSQDGKSLYLDNIVITEAVPEVPPSVVEGVGSGWVRRPVVEDVVVEEPAESVGSDGDIESADGFISRILSWLRGLFV